MEKNFNKEEIQTLVNAFNEEEFTMLKETVNQRNLEDYNIPIGEIDPNNRVVDNEEVIKGGHTFLYGQKQIDYLRKKYDKEKEEGTMPITTCRPIIRERGTHQEPRITEASRKKSASLLFGTFNDNNQNKKTKKKSKKKKK